MRIILLILILVTLPLSWARAQHTLDSARCVRVRDMHGAEHSLGEYLHGKTLLHVWGTWCSECLETYPAYDRLIDSLHQDSVQQDSIKAVNVAIEINGFAHWQKVTRRVAKRATTELQLYFDSNADPDPDRRGFLWLPWIKGIPAYLAVDSAGKVVGEWYDLPARRTILECMQQHP